ncbi:MAG: hypothetical protein ABJL44_15440 [Algibacter sp.]
MLTKQLYNLLDREFWSIEMTWKKHLGIDNNSPLYGEDPKEYFRSIVDGIDELASYNYTSYAIVDAKIEINSALKEERRINPSKMREASRDLNSINNQLNLMDISTNGQGTMTIEFSNGKKLPDISYKELAAIAQTTNMKLSDINRYFTTEKQTGHSR